MKKSELFNNQPYMSAWEEIRNGEKWTFVETGPAITVIPIRKKGSSLEILLTQERRSNGKRVLKAVGQYLRGRATIEGTKQALLQEAGVTVSRLFVMCNEMVGFEVIRLPITILVGVNWQIVQEGTAQRVILSLDEAMEKVFQNKIGDQSTVDGLLRIDALYRRNRLPS
jgi:hypothetical protein